MAVTTSVLGFQTWHESSHALLAGLSQARMMGVLKRYATFPKFSAMATLLNSFSGHIAMAAWQRDRLYGEIRRRVAGRSNAKVRRHWGAVLHVARRA